MDKIVKTNGSAPTGTALLDTVPASEVAVPAPETATPTHPAIEGFDPSRYLTKIDGRDGGAEWGLAVCDLDDGTRCYAKILDPDHLAQAESEELVGAVVSLVPGDNNANVVKELFT